jgi:hypothetical protein
MCNIQANVSFLLFLLYRVSASCLLFPFVDVDVGIDVCRETNLYDDTDTVFNVDFRNDTEFRR